MLAIWYYIVNEMLEWLCALILAISYLVNLKKYDNLF